MTGRQLRSQTKTAGPDPPVPGPKLSDDAEYRLSELARAVKKSQDIVARPLDIQELQNEYDKWIAEYNAEVIRDASERGLRQYSSPQRQAAKQKRDDAKKRLEAAKKAAKPYRCGSNQLVNRVVNEAKLEDVLHYKNIAHRKLRAPLLKGEKAQPPFPTNTGVSKSQLFVIKNTPPPAKWLHKLLENYDKDSVGEFPLGEDGQIKIPPEDFHTCTPHPKRYPRRSERHRQRREYLRTRIFDFQAAEERRKEFDDQMGGDVGPDPNHSARRMRELALPNTLGTANMKLIGERNTRTNMGLWISATETPDDWKTSYCRQRPHTPSSPLSSISSSSSDAQSQTPPGSPSQSSSSSSSSDSPRPPPPGPPTGPNENDPYDSDVEDPLLLEYTKLVWEIYGLKPPQGN